jgi:hypothetical protein
MSANADLLATAWLTEREAFRAVVRWRALYSKCRKRMRLMDDVRAADRLHYRLKDEEYAAIEAHQAALRRLRLIGAPHLVEESVWRMI